MNDIKIAVNIAKKANRLLAKFFHTLGTKTLRLKNNDEIVTDADLKSNSLISRELTKRFPEEIIISEEKIVAKNPGQKVWYIDPLDGTSNFSHGLREFGVCLARTDKKNRTDISVIGLPLAREVYWAENKRAFLNGRPIKVSDRNKLNCNLIFLYAGRRVASKKRFIKMLKKMDGRHFRIRMFAAASVELTAVASGRADGCILPEIKPWDVLAGIELVRAAGGKVTNLKGEPWTKKDTALVASNGGPVHNDLLAFAL